MLDLFAILTKGGLVLWCLERTPFSSTLSSVNSLIRDVILQERGGVVHTHEALKLHYKLDNEFELVFIVAYQKILQLSFIDRLLDQIYLSFRDKYRNELVAKTYNLVFNFGDVFNVIHGRLEEEHRLQKIQGRQMQSFDQVKKGQKSGGNVGQKKDKAGSAVTQSLPTNFASGDDVTPVVESDGEGGEEEDGENGENDNGTPSDEEDDTVEGATQTKSLPIGKGIPRGGTRRRVVGKAKKPSVTALKVNKSPKAPAVRVKENRVWGLGGSSRDVEDLDRSDQTSSSSQGYDTSMVGTMKGELAGLDSNPVQNGNGNQKQASGGGGIFGLFKSLSGGKTITMETMEPVLEKMKEHLIGKNVAADIASKLCESVADKLDGKVIGTFTGVTSQVRSSMEDSLVKILTPKRRVDILRDVMQAKEEQRPYVITFCGVNGVGKSTNLAKICFWLLENGFRVMIAACDTFRSGAVEQLKTHLKHLSSLHPPSSGGPPKVCLCERGYGKDSAGLAMEAIHSARQQRYDVVLVDTAGRMQDNEPLMRALAKLIRVNNPDLVLFVGEALVGNEAVDQLVKFNRALADHSDAEDPRLIDGILLTKFDTIDDKVGAAISMTYITGQPIVFVGTGQTYRDLKSLNVQAVVQALLS